MILIFISGNIITVFDYMTFIIYDNYFNNNIQANNSSYNNWIYYVDIYGENIFLFVQMIKLLKIWIKNNNEYLINKIINKVHDGSIYKVIKQI